VVDHFGLLIKYRSGGFDTLEASMAMQRWESEERRYDVRELSGSPARQPQLGPCLFVSRETGAGGGEIARRAADCLGWHLLDKEIVDQLSSQYGISRVMLDVVDEKKIDWLADILNGLVEGNGFSQAAYVHRLHRLFTAAAQQGKVVIVGRGARFMLPRQAGFSVRIVAPLQERVNRIASRCGLSAGKARAYIKRLDKLRDDFLQSYFHHDVRDPAVHDLVINTEQLGADNSLDVLIAAVHAWLKTRPPAPPVAEPYQGAAWPPRIASRAPA
jgi:cytidylate kinase